MTEVTCPVCDDGFDTAGAVRDHAWDAHDACHYCGEELTTKDELYVHWLATHEADLSRVDRNRAESEVGELSFGNRLTHQGPVGAVTNTSISRRNLLAGGAVAVAGIGGVAAKGLFGSSSGSQAASGRGTSRGATAAPATFTTIDGTEKQLADYRGQKVMFWVFATWCPSCRKAARALQANNERLQDITFIALKSHGNAGHSGSSVSEFAQQYAPELLNADNWVWGTLSKESTQVWNPQNRPDIYWLIDQAGTIVAKTAAPAATMDRIVQFAKADDPGDDRPGESIRIQPAKHIQPGASHPAYNSNPPTSGWHYPTQADWGFYTNKLPDERGVHNLEHGGIWITYSDVSEETRSNLRDVTQQYPKSVIVTKRSENDAPIAAASWGQLLKLEAFDRDRIIEFIDQNRNHSPEPIAGK